MSTPLDPLKIENQGLYGVIRPAEVNDSLQPEGAVTDAVNFHFDRKGAATVRPGVTALGATLVTARPCVGLHNAQQGTVVAVFSNGNTSAIYSYDGSAWGVSLDGGTASVKIRFVDFGSYTIAINFIYNTYSSMRFWNAGSSRHWHFTGNPINPQNMWGFNPQIGEVYKNRVYVMDGSRLIYSSVISSAGNITWSPTADFVDINPGDGEIGSALKRYGTELLIFKPNYIYRFTTAATDPDPLIKVGTRSQESVVEGKRGLYFHHDTGFYIYSGTNPTEISRPISDIVEAIPFSQYDDIIGWNDSDHVYWSIGTVTVTESGLSDTIKNAVIRYTESSQVWTVYSLAFDIRRAITYVSGTTISRIAGTDNGLVVTLNSGVTDVQEPIEYRMRTKWNYWGSASLRKVINEMISVCEKGQGMTLMYQIDDDPKWYTIGQIKKMVTVFNNLTIRFHRIRFRVTGMTRFESPIFLGLDVVRGINEGIVE